MGGGGGGGGGGGCARVSPLNNMSSLSFVQNIATFALDLFPRIGCGAFLAFSFLRRLGFPVLEN